MKPPLKCSDSRPDARFPPLDVSEEVVGEAGRRRDLLLGPSPTAELAGLAADLVPVFKARRIHRAALAALRLYAIAAKRQAATAGFTRDLLDYFFRARHDQTLRFKARAGGVG